MKTLVIYASAYGNTAKIANAVCMSLSEYGESAVKQVDEFVKRDMDDLDILVIGSPTQGGKPTKPAQQFIDQLPIKLLKQTKVAIFDTRFEASKQKLGMRLLMRIIGYAATKMAKRIKQRGGRVLLAPKGFMVSGTEGPLERGELEEAGAWAAQLVSGS